MDIEISYHASSSGRIAVLKMCSESNLNALSSHGVSQMAASCRNLPDDCKVLIITGVARAFSVGVDVHEFEGRDCQHMYGFLGEDWQALSKVQIPVLAAVNGYALGAGFEMCLMCDVIFAAEDALFGLPEVKLGLMPGNGGTQRLLRVAGMYRAKNMCFSGEMMSASYMRDIGVVQEVCSHPLDAAMSYAHLLCGKSSAALRRIKSIINMSEKDLCFEHERDNFYSLFSTAEVQHAIEKFVGES